MSIIYTLSHILLEDSAVSAMVGTRVYEIEALQGNPLPDIIINSMTGDDERTLEGSSKIPEMRFRVECRALKRADAINLGTAVIECLDNVIHQVYGLNHIDYILKGETDATDSASDHSTFRRIIDFDCRYHYVGS